MRLVLTGRNLDIPAPLRQHIARVDGGILPSTGRAAGPLSLALQVSERLIGLLHNLRSLDLCSVNSRRLRVCSIRPAWGPRTFICASMRYS